MHDVRKGPASVAAEDGADIQNHSVIGHRNDSTTLGHPPESSGQPRTRRDGARQIGNILHDDPSISRQLDYPVHALGPLRDLVEAVQRLTQAPVAIAAQSALAVAALAAQAHADARTFHGRTPLSLYLMTIARSGERKSACDKLIMRGVRDFEARLAERYRTERATFERRHQAWTTQRDQMLRRTKDESPDALAQRIEDQLGPEPEPPLIPLIVPEDPTFEGLTRLLVEGQPSVGVFTDEGGSFIGGFSMGREKLLHTLAGYSKLWDGSPINRTRALDGSATLRSRRVSMHLMAQPRPAKQLLANPIAQDQGFLARFLMVEPKSAIGRRPPPCQDPESAQIVEHFGQELLDRLFMDLPLRDQSRQELEPRLLDWSREADAVFRKFYSDIEREQARGRVYEHLTAQASKASEQAARLAGVLAWWENPEVEQLEGKHAEMGCTLARFYLREALRIHERAHVSQEEEQAEKLKEWLTTDWPELARDSGRGDGRTVTRRDCQQLGPNSVRDGKLLRRILELLVEDGFLSEECCKARGRSRPRQRYRILGGNGESAP